MDVKLTELILGGLLGLLGWYFKRTIALQEKAIEMLGQRVDRISENHNSDNRSLDNKLSELEKTQAVILEKIDTLTKSFDKLSHWVEKESENIRKIQGNNK